VSSAGDRNLAGLDALERQYRELREQAMSAGPDNFDAGAARALLNEHLWMTARVALSQPRTIPRRARAVGRGRAPAPRRRSSSSRRARARSPG
jgi:hypothetical protein